MLRAFDTNMLKKRYYISYSASVNTLARGYNIDMVEFRENTCTWRVKRANYGPS